MGMAASSTVQGEDDVVAIDSNSGNMLLPNANFQYNFHSIMLYGEK